MSEAAPQTWAEIRDGCVVRQQFDFSCGLASLATMLQFEFGMDTSERELLEELLALASPSTVKTGQEQAVLARATDRCGASVSFAGDAREELLQNGASLLQLWCLAQMHGKQAFVRQADLSFLRQNLDRPIIVHLKLGENLKHFAVLRKIDGRWVHLADPSRGCKVYLLSEFQEEWQRPEVLLLHEPTDYVPLSGRLGGTAAAAEIERRRQEAVRILHQ
ncbi:MAG: cysteine peptidase family C39 domain-containing protein [Pseudomonadota bacterium]